MARHINREKGDSPGTQGKPPDQITAQMPGGLHQKHRLGPVKWDDSFRDQRQLQATRLGQVALQGVVKVLQIIVALPQFGLHLKDAFTRVKAGLQFRRIDGFGQKIVGPAGQTIGHGSGAGFRADQDKIAVSIAGQGAEGTAKIRPRHAGHDPIAKDEIKVALLCQRQSLRTGSGLRHIIPPTAKLHGQHLPLCRAVICDQNTPGTHQIFKRPLHRRTAPLPTTNA